MFLRILFLVVLLAAFGFSCSFFDNTDKISVKTDTSEKADVSVKIDTSDWQSYSNQEIGFSFLYPSDLVPNIFDDSEAGFGVTVSENFPEQFPGQWVKFSVYRYNDFYKFLEQYSGGSAKNLSEYVVSTDSIDFFLGETKIDDRLAYEMTFVGHSATFVILSEDGEGLFLLTFPGLENRDQLSPIQQEILSSFRFAK
jgi:hypothetical protein